MNIKMVVFDIASLFELDKMRTIFKQIVPDIVWMKLNTLEIEHRLFEVIESFL
jgi:hypothetical protein